MNFKIKRLHLFFAIILLLIIFFLALPFISGSSEKKEHENDIDLSELNILSVDSLFFDLQKEQTDKRASIIDSIFNRLRKKTGFNGTVLYAEHDQIVYQNAFGFSDLRKNKQSLTIDSQFQLASVSKMFTAMAIMILKNEGKIDYDADLKTYIPEWPYDDYTVRLLLNHRSGVSRYESLAHDKWKNKDIPMSNEDLIQLYIDNQPSQYFKPNDGFHYCNANYALLATVVERVSGKNFEDFMEECIFKPLGMDHSFIYSMRNDTVVSDYIPYGVPGYDFSKRRVTKVRNDYLNGVMGDKIMYSTVNDMYKFNLALDYQLLVPDSILQEAFKPGSPTYRKRKDGYGFGWRIKADQDSAVYHYGWWKGFRSFFIRDMKNQRTLIILTNKDKGPGADHFWEIIRDTTITLPPSSVNISKIFDLDENNRI